MDDEEFTRKLQEAFAVEAGEHLQAMIAGLIEMEKAPPGSWPGTLLETIFREAHSLKGAARAVTRTDVESLCQAVESVFSNWKRDRPTPAPEAFDLLNRALDLIGRLLEQPEHATGSPEKSALLEMTQNLNALAATGATTAPPAPPAAKPVTDTTVPEAPERPRATAPANLPSAPPPAPAGPKKEPGAETVRIPVAKLDSLLLKAEEMVTVKLAAAQAAGEMRTLAGSIRDWRRQWKKQQDRSRNGRGKASAAEFAEWSREFLASLEHQFGAASKEAEHHARQVATQVDALLADAKQLVLLPFATLLDLFPKQVRDLARAADKEVNLVLTGREVEIDKRILEEMKDPLIHLVRNAIDHGIESAAQRAANGKSSAGSLEIAIQQEQGSNVSITIADDGGGIDQEEVKRAAVQSGILSQDQAAALTEKAALKLIFSSGVSTSETLTEISGRGLGMAIVREKVVRLGGKISIQTEPGRGTSFRLLLPVTLATFKGVLVRAAGQIFVVPSAAVHRILRIAVAEIHPVEGRETMNLDGEPLALTRLADVLGIPGEDDEERLLEALVLGSDEKRIAFVVDEVINEQEVLVKKLGHPLRRVRHFTAATLIGAGVPALILNVPELLESASQPGHQRARPIAGAKEKARQRRLLVVDDSLTSRMLLKNILEGAGYHITTAVDGLAGWKAATAGEFDLVISDVEMPQLNGFQLTEKIRTDPKLSHLPVILVTALGSREDQGRGLEAGASAYIIKSSFDQSDLLEAVRRLAEG